LTVLITKLFWCICSLIKQWHKAGKQRGPGVAALWNQKRIVNPAALAGKIIIKKIFLLAQNGPGFFIHSLRAWGWLHLSTIPVDNLVY
jgi:hypothetical protein